MAAKLATRNLKNRISWRYAGAIVRFAITRDEAEVYTLVAVGVVR